MSSRRPGPGMPPGMPGLPPGVSPEMIQQMMSRMPAGKMPPGPMGQLPQQQQQAPTKERYNPLPEGPTSSKILKMHAGCPMPREAASLNAMLQKAQETPPPPEHEEELYQEMSKAVTLVFKSDRECDKHVTTRTAGLFNEEPELKDLSDKIDTLFKECTDLEAQLKTKAEELNNLSRVRWEKSIKAFGLNIQDRFYRIDGEKRCVQQIDLRCEDCQCAKDMRDVRQSLTRIIIGVDAMRRKENVTVEAPKEEQANGQETAGRGDVPGPNDGAPDKAPGEDADKS